MSLERPRQDNLDVPSSEVNSPSPTTLAALTAIGMLAALWALFLWAELVLERSGGAAFCPFGGRAACAAIWSSGFARAVHRVTGVPVAGWGLVWSLEAFALPLLALQRAARRRPLGSFVSAVRLTAAAGVVVVLLLVAVSAAERACCAGCLVSYLLAAAYAGFAFSKWKRAGFSQPGRGLALALGSAATAFLLLLYPGLKTPRASGEAGRRALAEVRGRHSGPPPAFGKNE